MRHGFVRRALGATIVVLLTACTGGSTQANSGATAAAVDSPSGLPAIYSNGAISNVSFYYSGDVPLTPDNVEDLRNRIIGTPAIVVTAPGDSDAQSIDSITAIHALDSSTKAYRYINLYWAAVSKGSHEGVQLTPSPNLQEWAFCQRRAAGNRTPVVGLRASGGEPLYFLDLNERTVFDAIRTQLHSLKQQGWDGVMFDRGLAATQTAVDINGNKLFARTSTCTDDPVTPGAPLSTAFVRMLGVAKQAGLAVMMNNGRSPFDEKIKMRPDPRSAACRASSWSSCRFIGDVWSKVDLVLNEAPAHPRAVDWDRDFRANQRSETHSTLGHRTVALITSDTLGGEDRQDRANVYYQWSRVKLFNMAVAVNTGTGGCLSPGECNRFGIYPELADVEFGRPLRAGPAKQACLTKGSSACVWTRTYAKGVNVLNRTSTTKRVTIILGVTGCRVVTNVRTGGPPTGCVTRVRLTLPPWSGTPLVYSTP